MKEIEFKFSHEKIIFKIGEENYFMSAEKFLDILDRQKAHDIFESLNIKASASLGKHEIRSYTDIKRFAGRAFHVTAVDALMKVVSSS